MRYFILLSALMGSFFAVSIQAQTQAVSQLLYIYSSQGAGEGDINQGRELWQRKYRGKGEYKFRSCSDCHTDNLTKKGRHIKTSKAINPMSPTVNTQRLTKIRKIKKWFKRNCKWTMGRECTAQEKANILAYISNQ